MTSLKIIQPEFLVEPPQLVLKQVWATIDERTTNICVLAAGQIKPVDEPFDTLSGSWFQPPFHWGCRSMSVPWMRGMINDQLHDAGIEIKRRPQSERDVMRHPEEHRNKIASRPNQLGPELPPEGIPQGPPKTFGSPDDLGQSMSKSVHKMITGNPHAQDDLETGDRFIRQQMQKWQSRQTMTEKQVSGWIDWVDEPDVFGKIQANLRGFDPVRNRPIAAEKIGTSRKAKLLEESMGKTDLPWTVTRTVDQGILPDVLAPGVTIEDSGFQAATSKLTKPVSLRDNQTAIVIEMPKGTPGTSVASLDERITASLADAHGAEAGEITFEQYGEFVMAPNTTFEVISVVSGEDVVAGSAYSQFDRVVFVRVIP